MALKAGTEIICSCGNVCGHILRDLPDETIILAEDLTLRHAETHRLVDQGYEHLCTDCGLAVTSYRDGFYRIRTAAGWLGRLPV